jgi:hypothetical protein
MRCAEPYFSYPTQARTVADTFVTIDRLHPFHPLPSVQNAQDLINLSPNGNIRGRGRERQREDVRIGGGGTSVFDPTFFRVSPLPT